MATSRAITIASIIGAVLLVPVIVILALGLYGSSITGDFPLSDDSGPNLTIQPPTGTTGSKITLRGHDWVPQTLLRLEMIVVANQPYIGAGGTIEEVLTKSPAIFVEELIVSRGGTFTVDTRLPTTLPLAPQTTVVFKASATYRGGESAGESRKSFPVIAGAGTIEATVQDTDGKLIKRGVVELLSNRGNVVATIPISTSGTARFGGLPTNTNYDVRARVPGYTVGRSDTMRLVDNKVSRVLVQMSLGLPGRIVVGGVPRTGRPETTESHEPPTMALVDLPSMSPMPTASTANLPAVWAMASDSTRGRIFVLDEAATAVHVVNPITGVVDPPIPLAFPLQLTVIDEGGQPVPSATIRLFWNIRGQRVFVREARTGLEGRARIPKLISGSSYNVFVTAPGYFQPLATRTTATIVPNKTTSVTVVMRAEDTSDQLSPLPITKLPGTSRAPATSLVVADIAIEPMNGHLYVTGSDLTRGHLFVLDPETGHILHDWTVPAGVGDIVPAGDGQTVFITNRPFSTVARMSIKTGQEESRVTVPSWPESLARDASGGLFVASLRDGSVTRLNPTTLGVEAVRQLDEGINRLAVDEGSNTLIAINQWTHTITGLALEDLKILFLLPVAESPRAVAIDSASSSLIVASKEMLSVYSPKTFELVHTLRLPMPIHDVVTIALPPHAP